MKKMISSESRFLTITAILFAIMVNLNSCTKNTVSDMPGMTNPGSKGGTVNPGANEVWIQSMLFNPSLITVTEGTTIKWTNKDAVSHTVTSDAGVFDSGVIGNNGTFSYLFSTAGSYKYHCSIHPLMTATVVVSAAPVANAAVSIENMSFVPASLTVAAGTTVVWTNNDSMAHTVTSNTGLFDSGLLSAGGLYTSGGTFSYTFSTAGTFLYHCTPHPGMIATIIVN
jgi:plastocyanin